MSDLIGNALRADCVAYWKMDEASGTRIDATGRGNDLVDINSNVGSASGKVAQASMFIPNPLLSVMLQCAAFSD